MAYLALKDKLPHFKKGDVVEINMKYAKDLLEEKIIKPMKFDETKKFFESRKEAKK